jgi:hypothetical protein
VHLVILGAPESSRIMNLKMLSGNDTHFARENSFELLQLDVETSKAS